MRSLKTILIGGAGSLLLAGGLMAQAQPKPRPKITEAQARATALAQVPGAKVRSEEFEHENGRWIYSYDLKVAGRRGIEEINVDAMTGKVVAHEHEGPKAEANEAAREHETVRK